MLDAVVKTILSQNTTNVNSSRAFSRLKAAFPTWEAVAAAEPAAVQDAIRCGGLAASKTARIQAMLHTIREERGEVSLEHLRSAPSAAIKAELSRFKGVGPKTISCVLLFELQRPDFAVDTHIHRIAGRLGWTPRVPLINAVRRAAPAGDAAVRAAVTADLAKHSPGAAAAPPSPPMHTGTPAGPPCPDPAPSLPPAKRPRRAAAAASGPSVPDTGRDQSASEHAAGEHEGKTLDGALDLAWPPVTRETTYTHLNATLPDSIKYPLHILLIDRACIAQRHATRPKQHPLPLPPPPRRW